MSRLDAQSDENLMALYQQGEVSAFATLYDRHAGMVLGYLRRRCRNESDCQDLLQHVFLRLHENRDCFDPARPFLPWLFTIARNSLVDAWRKNRETFMEPGSLNALQEMDCPSEPTPQWTWEEMMKILPPSQRHLIQLRYAEELSYAEIAGSLRATELSTRKRLSRAIQALRRAVGAAREEEVPG